MKDDTRKALRLCLLALANYGLFYGLSVYLARTLDADGFEEYSVAVATVLMLASFATLGLEKFALRALPGYHEKRDWGHAFGFAAFGARIVLLVSIGLTVAYAIVHVRTTFLAGEIPEPSIVLAVLLLPIVALVLFLIEVVTANGEAVRATMVYRLLLPVSVVVSVGAAVLLIDELTAVQAIVCYGLGWIVSLVVIIRLTFKTTRHEVRSSGKMYAPRSWIGRSVPFLLRSVMMTQFASLPIIVLKLGSHDQQIVGTYAACMQTAGFIVLVATATNRFYSPKAAVLIDRKDYHGMKVTIRERHAWLRPVILFYLLAMVLFGRPILGLYGEAFVAGYPALLLIAAGSAIGVAFSMAPFYLQFVGQNKLVLGITTAAGLLNIGLLFPLAGRWGATGAAAAYAISLGAMSIAFRVLALRGVNRTLDELEAREAGASS